MTTAKAKKLAVRSRMTETGESYTEALRHIEEGQHGVVDAATDVEQAEVAAEIDLADYLDQEPTVTFDRCANCDADLDMTIRGLFCSEFCKQLADFVRYARRKTSDPAQLADPEIRYAIEIRMAHLMGGGYREQERRLTDEKRKAAKEQDGSKCRQCGEPGTEIDHIVDGSDDLSNLQLLCRDCHKQKTAAALRPASPEQQAWAKALYETRILVAAPSRLCDDEIRWPQEWGSLKRQRTKELWELLEYETDFTRADYRGWKWEDIVGDAYDPNILPGEDVAGVWEDIDPAFDGHVGTEEEVEEGLYMRAMMERD